MNMTEENVLYEKDKAAYRMAAFTAVTILKVLYGEPKTQRK